jgi:CHAT domain-containing protein/tetratricopeptide (TPR) repeat protein
MRSTTFTVVLLASILLLSHSTSFAQAADGLECPPHARASDAERQALLATTRTYLAALKAKDWDAALGAAGSFLTGFNTAQALMRDLFEPLDIERMSFDLAGAAVKPCQASVPYTLSVKAIDPRTRQPAIDVTGLRRVTHWIRLKCDCPPENLTPWLLVRDQSDVGETAKALAAAKSPKEQRLLLLNMDEEELKGLASALARRGYESFKQGRDAEALAAFGLNRAVVGQMKHHRVVWNRSRAGVLEGVLAEAEKRNDVGARGQLLSSLVQAYVELGEYARARKLFEDGLRLPGHGRGVEAAGAYAAIATIHRNRGEYERAVAYYVKSAEIYKPLAGRDGDAREGLMGAFFNLAFLYEALGREDLARKAYDELGRTAGPGSLEEALFFLLRGVMKTVKGQVAEAIADLESASGMLARAESEDKNTLAFMASYMLVEPYLRRGDYPRAGRQLAWARDVLQGAKGGDVPEDFVLLFESMLYGVQGDKRLAASRTAQFIGGLLSQFLNEPPAVERATGGGREDDSDFAILPNLMALNAAGTLLAGVLEDAPPTPEPFDTALVLNAAAFSRFIRGDLPGTREWLRRALRLAEEDGNVILAAQTHERLANIYRREKNYPQALAHYRKSLQTLEGARLPLSLHLTERDPNTTIVWWGIARIHAEAGDFEQALAAYQKIFERGRFYRLLDTTILHEMAEANFKLGRHGDALAVVERALLAAERGGDRDVLWKLHTLAGKVHRALKRDDAAARSFAEAIREVEASRARVVGGDRITARFFEDKLGPYQEMIAMLVGQGKCSEALAYSERSKSRVLLDVLRRGDASSRPLTDAERKRERALRVRMFGADREYAAVQAGPRDDARESQLRVKRLEARLEYESFRIGLLLPGDGAGATPNAPPEVIEPTEYAALLPTGGTLLEFAVTDEKTYLFVLTQGSTDARGGSTLAARCEVHAIPLGADSLNARVAEFNLRIANRAGVVRPLARELYDLLLRPARAALAGRTSIVIVPDRGLWTLPFQALQGDDGRYLLQETAISYAPSLMSLREMRKPRATRAGRSGESSPGVSSRPPGAGLRLFVVANPAGSLPPLPSTEALAYRLARLYGPGLSKVYVGARASEGRVKNEARGFDIIHISAHGILDDDDAMYSRVELAGAGRGGGGAHGRPRTRAPAEEGAEDGLLEAWEIMDLELDADLMVLSACETARGRIGNGEGIVGLTWAMFMAGIPASVVSQWVVDEDATSELMYLFHENLSKGRGTDPARLHRAESLRQSSLKLLSSSRYGHPYYWAGFILIGDGR